MEKGKSRKRRVSAVTSRDDPAGELYPDHEKLTVESYMLATMTVYDLVRGKAESPGSMELILSKKTTDTAELSTKLNRLLWAFLREARLFHFDPRMFSEIYHQIDAKLLVLPSALDDQGRIVIPERLSDKSSEALYAASSNAPYPEKFPFESVYIGYGQGIFLNEYQAKIKFLNRLPDELPEYQCYLLGAVMSFSGYVWEFFRLSYFSEESSAYTFLSLRRPETKWHNTVNLAPWYLPVILETINDHKTFVIEGYPDGMRDMLRHARKKMGFKSTKNRGKFWVPPPYYRIKLQDKIVQKRLELSKPKIARKLQYRHDVRGHEKCCIRRGPLPLAVEARKDFLKRGYKVYEYTKPDDEMNVKLLKRGHVTKKPDEWLVIKVGWWPAHQQGPKDAPLIPGLRTTGGRKGGR